MPRTPLKTIRKELRTLQAEGREQLRGAIVGRPLVLPAEAHMNSVLGDVGEKATYRKAGQVALVYLFRSDLRQNRGQTFYNPIQVERAIQQAPRSVGRTVELERTSLRLIRAPIVESPPGLQHYWLAATAVHAVAADTVSSPRVSMRNEELEIANNLFNEDNDLTNAPQLWLGAILAPEDREAHSAKAVLENVIPQQLPAGPVGIIPRQS